MLIVFYSFSTIIKANIFFAPTKNLHTLMRFAFALPIISLNLFVSFRFSIEQIVSFRYRKNANIEALFYVHFDIIAIATATSFQVEDNTDLPLRDTGTVGLPYPVGLASNLQYKNSCSQPRKKAKSSYLFL